MIIKRITLDPFGNLSGRTFEFEKETPNLLLGKTGAGKTTVVDATYSAFFIDSMIGRNKPEYKDFIKKRYPLDGGNIVKVTVEFEHDDEEYELTKKWCKDKDKSEAILKGDSMSKRVGDKEVNEVLDDILPTNRGTFKNVLMASQAEMQEVFSIDDEVYSELDEKMRQNLKTDGVSPQKFLKEVEKEHDNHSKKWDFDKGRPETTNKGTLYEKGIGKIYQAYKEKKEKEDKLKEVQEIEKTIGEKNKKLSELSEELEDINDFLETNKEAYKDSGEREKLEIELRERKEKHDRLQEDFEEWEQSKDTISKKEGEISILQDNLAEKQEQKEELEKKIDIKEITRDLNQEQEKMEVGRLAGSIEAKEDTEIEIHKDRISDSETYTLEKGEEKEVEADVSLQITTNPIDLEIHSGQDDFEQRVQKIEDLKEKKVEKAEEYGIQLPIDKEDLIERKESTVEGIRKIKNDIDSAENSIDDAKKTIEDIKERQEVDKLSEIGDKRSEVKKQKEDIEGKLKELEEVPEEFSDASEFREEYEKLRDVRKDELIKEKTSILNELKDIDTPDIPSEELEEELEEKKREFQRVLKKGKAYRFLKEKTEKLLEEGNLLYQQLKDSIDEYFHRIYGDGFEGVDMDEMDVKGMSHPDGYKVKRKFLSMGQKDITALSVRLAMADYYLADSDGFMVMDDPLVNIDPEKRDKAIEVIEEISEEQQVLVMTCDPNHADMFDEVCVVRV